MADSAELAFVKNHINIIGSLPVQYPDDFQQPPASTLKKLPIIPVELPAPPPPKASGATQSESISLTFKSAKPPKSYTISQISTTETVSVVKDMLSIQPGAPPADAQRLLLKGKALVDTKLLKEYTIKDGDTINLMLRPGFEWNWEVKEPAPSVTIPPSPSTESHLSVDTKTPKRPGRHGRIPSVVLSPSPSPSSTSLPTIDAPNDIELMLDGPEIPSIRQQRNAFHEKVASPDFWARMNDFIKAEFSTPEDSRNAFEVFFGGAKGNLSPHEIAKIRDTIGISGMSGL